MAAAVGKWMARNYLRFISFGNLALAILIFGLSSADSSVGGRWFVSAASTQARGLAEAGVAGFNTPSATESTDVAAADIGSFALVGRATVHVFLKFMVQASGEAPEEKLKLFNEAVDYLQRYLAQPLTIKSVDTVEELHALRDSLLVENLGLEDELKQRRSMELPPRVVVSTSSAEVRTELQGMITVDMRAPFSLYTSIATKGAPTNWAGLGSEGLDPARKINGFLQILGLNERALMEGGEIAANQLASLFSTMSTMNRQAKLNMVGSFEAVIEGVFGEISGVGQRLADSQLASVDNPVLKRFLQIVIGEYFKRVDRPTLKNIVNDIIDRPESRIDDLSRFAVMVQNADPNFQKLFQVYARQEDFPEELSAILKRLERAVRPVPWVYVQQILAEEKVPFEWVSVERKYLGVGSMAQVHKAVIKAAAGKLRNVIARIVKPGSKKKLDIGKRILTEVAQVADQDPILEKANFPKLSPYMDQLYEMALIELNLAETTRNQNSGRRAYGKTTSVRVNERRVRVEIYVPEVIDIPENSRLMVQEFVEAMSFEDHQKRHPDLNRAVLEVMARFWLTRALVGESLFTRTGYFHADPHYGNLLVAGDENSVRLYPIDHGMGGKMERSFQNAFISFGVAVASGRPEFISSALWALRDSEKSRVSKEQFGEIIKQKVKALNTQNLVWSTFEWLSFAGTQGLVFSEVFAKFSRGLSILFRNLESVDSQISLQRELALILAKHPIRLLSLIFRSELFSVSEWYTMMRVIIQNRWKGIGGNPLPSYLSSKSNKSPAQLLRCEALF